MKGYVEIKPSPLPPRHHYDYTFELAPDGHAILTGWSPLTLSVGDGITIGATRYRVVEKDGGRHILEPMKGQTSDDVHT